MISETGSPDSKQPLGVGCEHMTSAPVIYLRYGLEENQRWFMELEDVPETCLHDAIIDLIKSVLTHRFRDGRGLVSRNLACRWDPSDRRIGVDPDVALLTPPPPEGKALESLNVWLPKHAPPKLAIEVVSKTNAAKDYREAPARMARLGGEELWIFDPGLHGPTLETLGGPYVLQIWRRLAAGDHVDMERLYAGPAPAYSPALDAWVVSTDGGDYLRVADDADGAQLWLTKDEAEAAQVEVERQRAEAAREVAEAERSRADTECERAEAQRQRAEAERKRAQAQRQRAEAERKRAQAQRQRAEAQRQRAEAERNRAEAERKTAEAERKTAEAERERAEAERERADSAEKKAETDRERAEAAETENQRLRALLGLKTDK